jgi:hypothetical protein
MTGTAWDCPDWCARDHDPADVLTHHLRVGERVSLLQPAEVALTRSGLAVRYAEPRALVWLDEDAEYRADELRGIAAALLAAADVLDRAATDEA